MSSLGGDARHRALELVWPADGNPPPETVREVFKKRASDLVTQQRRKLKTLVMVSTSDGGLRAYVLLLGDAAKQRLSWFDKELGSHVQPPVPSSCWRRPEVGGTHLGIEANLSKFREIHKEGRHYEEVPAQAAPISTELSHEANDVLNRLTDSRPLEELVTLPFDELVEVFESVAGANPWVARMQDFREHVVRSIRLHGGLSGGMEAPFAQVEGGLEALLSDIPALNDALEMRGFRTVDGSLKQNERQALASQLARARVEVAEWMSKQSADTEPMALSGSKRPRHDAPAASGLDHAADRSRMLALQEATRCADGPDESERRTRQLAEAFAKSTIDFATFKREMKCVDIDATKRQTALRVLQRHAELQEAAKKVKDLEAELASLLPAFIPPIDAPAFKELKPNTRSADPEPLPQAVHNSPQPEEVRSLQSAVPQNSSKLPLTNHTPLLLILACANGLPAVTSEASDLDRLTIRTHMLHDPTAEDVSKVSYECDWVHFAGHADPKLDGQRVLVFCNSGGLEAVDAETVVRLFCNAQLVVLNGCKSLELGAALAAAGVGNVACWETLAYDPASKLFASAFWRAMESSSRADGSTLRSDVRSAFERGKDAIMTATKAGGNLETESGGAPASTPRYALVDPQDSARVQQVGMARGRCLSTAGEGLSDRFAVGVPILLQPLPESALHDVPSLPMHYVPRHQAETELRGRVLSAKSLLAITAPAAITGTAGLGKTTIATWLARDMRVQTRFGDGIYWLRFGQEGSAMSRLRTLGLALGMDHQEVGDMRNDSDAIRQLKKRLEGQSCLIVCDDVWYVPGIEPHDSPYVSSHLSTCLLQVLCRASPAIQASVFSERSSVLACDNPAARGC